MESDLTDVQHSRRGVGAATDGITLVIRPLVFIGATVLWLFPLAAWVRRPAAGPAGGLGVSGPGTAAGPALPSARGIVWPALLGGAASWLAAALVMLGLATVFVATGLLVPIATRSPAPVE